MTESHKRRTPDMPSRFLIQPLLNPASRGRHGIEALPGDPLRPCPAPIVVYATSHDHAALIADRILRAPFPWSPAGLFPGDAIAVSGNSRTRFYTLTQHGLAEFAPAPPDRKAQP